MNKSVFKTGRNRVNVLTGSIWLIASFLADPAQSSEPAGVPFPSSQIRYDPKTDDSGWVPFEIDGGHIYLAAKVNGHDAPALLDSGASVIVINGSDGSRLGISASGTEKGNGAEGSAMSAMAHDVSVTVGHLTIKSDRIAMPDLTGIAQKLHRPVTVVLGGEFFRNTVVKINFSQKRLAFCKPSVLEVPKKAQIVPLHEENGLQLADVRVEGRRARMLFDLGNGGAMILRSRFWKRNNFLKNRRSTLAYSEGYAGGGWKNKVSVRTLRIGATTLSHVPTDLLDDSKTPSQSDGNIGLPVWSRFNLTIDFPRNRILLVPPIDALSPFLIDHHGLKVRQPSNGATIGAPPGP